MLTFGVFANETGSAAIWGGPIRYIFVSKFVSIRHTLVKVVYSFFHAAVVDLAEKIPTDKDVPFNNL